MQYQQELHNNSLFLHLVFKRAMHPKQISIADYTYHLPNERIAMYPLKNRDASKLLIYKNGKIEEDVYRNIAGYLPEKSLLVLNNTKVIQARIVFTKPTGGQVEIFLLEPYHSDYTTALTAKESCCWKCLIGGAKKWKETSLQFVIGALKLNAGIVEKLEDAYIVEFSWEPSAFSFAELLEEAGNIPLPPYIKRKPEAEDTSRYQTVYAKHDGSVAAPTAGLHFTKNVFASLKEKNISSAFVTLHVGAGTFKPVKAATMQQHEMHAEWIDVPVSAIENIRDNINNTVVAVGTTSLRTIESLYWLGVKATINPAATELPLHQWDVYEQPLCYSTLTATEALDALLVWMKQHNKTSLFTSTQILIAPGYTFKIAKAIITNFHQPNSTLLLLVAAAVNDDWKKIYAYALENDFRFLSYGDGSLLFIAE